MVPLVSLGCPALTVPQGRRGTLSGGTLGIKESRPPPDREDPKAAPEWVSRV